MIIPGSALADADWLARQLALFGQAWRLAPGRVPVTIWWYMAADALLAQPVRGGAQWPGAAVLDESRCTLRVDGSVAHATYSATQPAGKPPLPDALRLVLSAVIGPLATLGPVASRSLWGIAADAAAGHALAAGHPQFAVTLASELGWPMPTPRFETIAGSVFVRRTSCCLLHAAPGASMCISCPKRHPTERHALLAQLVRGNGGAVGTGNHDG